MLYQGAEMVHHGAEMDYQRIEMDYQAPPLPHESFRVVIVKNQKIQTL